ncbi:MAG: tRNA (N6-isopentenyl adenosine(37)-C2)-methylthiotransferase MiaB [Tissierellia bacterium]|nr:tRNA (N6-isopentenyl adenosine(37)-C2)-methylthiotransferase MiaB [Tissierellia bacterium]
MYNKGYIIHTFGCQMNEHDSEKIAWILENMGYLPVDSDEEADIILFNTCAIRQSAEDKVYGKVGSLKPMKNANPNKIIAIGGCMMNMDESRDKILKSHGHVDIIFGTQNLFKLPELIRGLSSNNKRIVDVKAEYSVENDKINAIYSSPYKALVNIMYGCNNFCTYCVVPYTRGREISRDPKQIISEIEKLVDKGTKEVMLLGQNVNSYGKSLCNNYNFVSLLKEINNIKGLKRIRFMTSHPKDISDELIESWPQLDKLCHSLHLPLQSGSNKVLKEMNRHYTQEKYINIVNKIKATVPDIALTTDLIVGFPGESEEDFEKTIETIKKVEYDSSYTFLYSPRSNTPAAERDDQIPHRVKQERFEKLLVELYPIALKKNTNEIGKIREVLVEGIDKIGENLVGRTLHGKLVNFPGDKDIIGSYVNVKIVGANTFALEGRLME